MQRFPVHAQLDCIASIQIDDINRRALRALPKHERAQGFPFTVAPLRDRDSVDTDVQFKANLKRDDSTLASAKTDKVRPERAQSFDDLSVCHASFAGCDLYHTGISVGAVSEFGRFRS